MVQNVAAGGIFVQLTNNSKYKCVCEMPVERQLDRVSPQFQSLDGLCQANKDVSSSQGKHMANFTMKLFLK